MKAKPKQVNLGAFRAKERVAINQESERKSFLKKDKGNLSCLSIKPTHYSYPFAHTHTPSTSTHTYTCIHPHECLHKYCYIVLVQGYKLRGSEWEDAILWYSREKEKRKMKIWCDVCDKEEASVFCCADEAALCNGCDRHVHFANKLAGKHLRFSLNSPTFKDAPLCDICGVRPIF